MICKYPNNESILYIINFVSMLSIWSTAASLWNTIRWQISPVFGDLPRRRIAANSRNTQSLAWCPPSIQSQGRTAERQADNSPTQTIINIAWRRREHEPLVTPPVDDAKKLTAFVTATGRAKGASFVGNLLFVKHPQSNRADDVLASKK